MVAVLRKYEQGQWSAHQRTLPARYRPRYQTGGSVAGVNMDWGRLTPTLCAATGPAPPTGGSARTRAGRCRPARTAVPSPTRSASPAREPASSSPPTPATAPGPVGRGYPPHTPLASLALPPVHKIVSRRPPPPATSSTMGQARGSLRRKHRARRWTPRCPLGAKRTPHPTEPSAPAGRLVACA